MKHVDATREVPVAVVRQVVDAVLSQAGASSYERQTVAAALLAADLRGQHSHGLRRLPLIVARVRAGLIVPGAMSTVAAHGPSLATLDGNFGFGHVTAVDACHRVGELARQTGLGMLLVRHSNGFGMLAYYLERLARAGLVAVILSTTQALVHPVGGSEAMLGTNPIGITFPADPPFVLDMTTAATATARLKHARRRGERIPLTWAVDELGRPTDDPDAALRGALNPFGGEKGYGLGLAVTLLAGVLTGSATGRRVQGVTDARGVSTKGDLFLAVDPRALPWGREVDAAATAFLAEVRRSRPVDPFRPVLVPGDRARARASFAAEKDHMRLPARLWSALTLLAAGRND
jgi:L-2-hydroxycarboxylate dehydrogenase (NAD+)